MQYTINDKMRISKRKCIHSFHSPWFIRVVIILSLVSSMMGIASCTCENLNVNVNANANANTNTSTNRGDCSKSAILGISSNSPKLFERPTSNRYAITFKTISTFTNKYKYKHKYKSHNEKEKSKSDLESDIGVDVGVDVDIHSDDTRSTSSWTKQKRIINSTEKSHGSIDWKFWKRFPGKNNNNDSDDRNNNNRNSNDNNNQNDDQNNNNNDINIDGNDDGEESKNSMKKKEENENPATLELEPKSTTKQQNSWENVRGPSSETTIVTATSKSDEKLTNTKMSSAMQAQKNNDDGGDDIVYGPSKSEKKKINQKGENTRNSPEAKEKQEEEKQRSKVQRLSAYKRKKALREQQQKEKQQENKEGGGNNDDDAMGAQDPLQQGNQTKVDKESDVNEDITDKQSNRKHGTATSRQATYLVMGSSPPQGPSIQYRSAPPNPRSMPPNQALAVAAVASLSGSLIKLWIIIWVTRRLAAESEMMSPAQHFIWECLNDRYNRDQKIFAKVVTTPVSGFSQWKWNKYLKSTRSDKNLQPPKLTIPNKTVVVVDITPNFQLDIAYLTDVVSFLITAQRQNLLGKDPEIVMLLRSPGGEVTTYGLAAAQVARLKQSGIQVTTCVDSIAASGGYMIASQSSQIIAAPFAMVGSIGVIREGLNYNKLLTNYGIKPLVVKAGEMKNPLSSLAPVTEADIQAETERLEETHKAFIDWCLSRRPALDLAVCDGTVLLGKHAIDRGMVDRVLTSDEYIWEKIHNGDHVLKLHKSLRDTDRTRIFTKALDLLPHLRHHFDRFQRQIPLSKIAQGYAIFTIVQRALSRNQSYE